jgi:hypothetical protein
MYEKASERIVPAINDRLSAVMDHLRKKGQPAQLVRAEFIAQMFC